MKGLIAVLVIVLLSGCGTWKREMRNKEIEAVRSITDSSLFLLCASPIGMMKEQLPELDKQVGWDIMCDHNLMGYHVAKDTE